MSDRDNVIHLRHTSTGFGELGGCSVCRSWEGEMPQDCPGREMTAEERQAVLEGRLDYRRAHGGWTAYTRSLEARRRRMYDDWRGFR